MAKRSSKRKPDVKHKASGVLAAATQDLELTVEQAEAVAEKTVRAAAAALGKLGGVKGAAVTTPELPEDKRFESTKKAAKPRPRKKLD